MRAAPAEWGIVPHLRIEVRGRNGAENVHAGGHFYLTKWPAIPEPLEIRIAELEPGTGHRLRAGAWHTITTGEHGRVLPPDWQ